MNYKIYKNLRRVVIKSIFTRNQKLSIRSTLTWSAVGLLAVFSLFPVGSPGEGDTFELRKGLKLLSVNVGYSTMASEILTGLGFSLANDSDLTVSTANHRGYGNAVELLTGKAPKGLLLKVTPGSPGYKDGFRDKDIVREVTLASSCSSDKLELEIKWRMLRKCGGLVGVSRSDGDLIIKTHSNSIDGVTFLKARADKFIPTPRALNSHQGTSGGLAFSLYHLDRLSPGDLFSSDKVAATGGIFPSNGHFSHISKVREKANAASKEGVEVLFVPKGQKNELPAFSKMRVYEVASLKEAVIILCARGADDAVCEKVL